MVRVDGSGSASSLVHVRGLDKKYYRGGEEIHVLQGLNLDVDQGDFVAFMGPSGSGKTTLLNLLGGLDVPSAGSITVAGDEITHMSRSKLRNGARGMWASSSRCTTSSRCSPRFRTWNCRCC